MRKNFFELFFFSFFSVISNEENLLSKPFYSAFSKKNYMIVASQILRSRITFGIAVHVFDDPSFSYKFLNQSFQFQAVITSNNDEIVSYRETLYWNYPQMVYFPTPASLSPASYELRVIGVSSNEIEIFDETTKLVFDEKFVCVSFQTSRPIYRSGQIVKFRILVLETTLLPFNDVMDVFIIDPDNFIIKRWLSTYTNNGVASLHFKLPKLAKNGLWIIQSKIGNQIDEKQIIVHTYYQPYFEVIVDSSPFTSSDEDAVRAKVYGIFPSQKFVRANATISWLACKFLNSSLLTVIQTETIFIMEEKTEVSIPMQKLKSLFDKVSEIQVKIEAKLTEFMSGETVSGFSHTRIITSNMLIKFLSNSPAIFTPGTIFSGYVAVHYEDQERIPKSILENSTVKVQITTDVTFPNGKLTSDIEIRGSYDEDYSTNVYNVLNKKAIKEKFLMTSVVPFSFDIPKGTSHVELKAYFIFNEKIIEDRMPVIRKYLPQEKYIDVWTTSEHLSVGDDAVFHVKMNFEVEIFYTVILAKGMILQLEEHKVISSAFSSVTFSKYASPEMAPLFHLIAYCFHEESASILSDVVSVPVDGFSRYETTLEINTGKDFRAETVEALASGAEGSFIGVQAVRSIVHHLQGGNEVTASSITKKFLETFEKNFRSVNKVTWIPRNGEESKSSHYFLSHDYAYDTQHIFSLNNLALLTNLNVPLNDHYNECNKFSSSMPCFTKDCFSPKVQCDGVFDCLDGTDESNCPSFAENREIYSLNRINWHSFIFDEKEGDWAFFEIRKNDHEGVEFQFLDTPITGDDWYFSAFNMDMKFGFSMISAPVIFSTQKPLMAHVLGPNQCRRGEQLGLKIYLHNSDTNRMFVTVTLLNSEDYKFVHVGVDGIVASYTARLSGGDHQKLIYMSPKSQEEIHFPVAPVRQQGIVEIKFEISSQAGRRTLVHCVEVLGEGALINRHTSVVVDLKNRGLILQYLDIIVDETPIVPYEIWRRYVFGSPAANITISNDVIGPVEESHFLTMNSLLKRESKGAMDTLFELYINIWSLHYLRLTNQLKWTVLHKKLTDCNSLYAEIMRYFHKDGWFNYWETSDQESSVWLTAWALRVFNDITFPDWEFHVWIDPIIFVSIVKWLLKHQNKSGFFEETSYYNKYHFDGRIRPNDSEQAEIILTAHVLISLYSSTKTIDGDLKTNASISCHKAGAALEKVLPTLKDPYAIAMVAYALSILSSSEAGFALDILRKHSRMNDEGLFYWSRSAISINPIKLENQRRYIGPRLYENSVSSAVEATSWALLVFLAREGISPFVESIVQWLVSVRMTNNGFISVSDTAVAYHALTEFALRSRILDITNIDLSVEMMTSSMTRHHLHISNKSATAYHFTVPHVWGHIDITARGSGLAFIQMDVNYGIDDERLVDKASLSSFQLQITEFYSTFRNKSAVTIESCLRHSAYLSQRSGAVILEIQIPTGYTLRESDAIELIKTRVHPTLKDVRIVEGKTIWFFDHLTEDLYCFNHTIKRWYPVANLTLHRHALLYEITGRENFLQVLINSTQLYTLSICEVCGSYQCPYCPYYNTAARSQSIFFNVVATFAFLIYSCIQFLSD